MINTILWLIGIVVAFVGVARGLVFQGEALAKPEESKRIGRRMRTFGWCWIGVAAFYVVVIIVLQLLGAKG